jgi:rod shape-determining protein MreD
MNPLAGGWLILLSLAVAMLLAVVHLPETLPDWLGWLRPVWVALVLFYWVMELPHRIGLIAAWIVGLFVDVLQADPLGLNGALLAAITFFGWRFYERLRMYALLQQGSVIFLLLIGTESVRMLVLALIDGRGLSWGVFGPPVMSLVAWPFVALVLDGLRRRVRVY